MAIALAWIAALGGLAATIGAWRTEARARWQARAERLRTDAARLENELHRQRFTEVWHRWHDMKDGPERVRLIKWYDEWTGAREPFGADADGPQAPGLHTPDEDEAYKWYVGFLEALYHPGRLGPPRPVTGRRYQKTQQTPAGS
jgi:hypothetical protein